MPERLPNMSNEVFYFPKNFYTPEQISGYTHVEYFCFQFF